MGGGDVENIELNGHIWNYELNSNDARICMFLNCRGGKFCRAAGRGRGRGVGGVAATANVAVACCMLFPPSLRLCVCVWQIERKCCLTNRRQRLKRLGWRL